ncbi:hypothetical protein QTO34_001397 [Cnephaeus nilssonii]|uniref:Uncharacterized protein n=1 Tax=Cnephaeus nilssonii TaxID=3371016 RepID=A0AA40LNG3_CNENI|nr:hypothetical protein QTO34_001397 [Eptesicus nilssonii]
MYRVQRMIGAANVSSSACGRLSGRVSSEMATRDEEETQKVPDAEPQFLLHGCEMPRMLQNHHHP